MGLLEAPGHPHLVPGDDHTRKKVQKIGCAVREQPWKLIMLSASIQEIMTIECILADLCFLTQNHDGGFSTGGKGRVITVQNGTA